MKRLTHFDKSGRARMVDVGGKKVIRREARARARMLMKEETIRLIKSNQLLKGDALNVARIAGIMAAKKTSSFIPLCHPLAIDWVDIDFSLGRKEITITSSVKIEAKTGVEMEALTAVSVAALAFYDMAKSADRTIVISDIKLLEKSKR